MPIPRDPIVDRQRPRQPRDPLVKEGLHLIRPELLAQVLQGWATVEAVVILDGVLVFGDRLQIFRLSLRHGNRAIPLVWTVIPGVGLTQAPKLEAMLNLLNWVTSNMSLSRSRPNRSPRLRSPRKQPTTCDVGSLRCSASN